MEEDGESHLRTAERRSDDLLPGGWHDDATVDVDRPPPVVVITEWHEHRGCWEPFWGDGRRRSGDLGTAGIGAPACRADRHDGSGKSQHREQSGHGKQQDVGGHGTRLLATLGSITGQ